MDAARDARGRIELPARAERVEEEGAGFFHDARRRGRADGSRPRPGRSPGLRCPPGERKEDRRRRAKRKGRGGAAARPRTMSPRAVSRLPSLSTPLPRWELRIWGGGAVAANEIRREIQSKAFPQNPAQGEIPSSRRRSAKRLENSTGGSLKSPHGSGVDVDRTV
jgi:hypothetical protein